MGLDAKQKDVFASSFSILVVATLAVILRFYARARSRTTVGYDDYFTLMSLVFFWAFTGVALWGCVSGFTETNYETARLIVSLKLLYINTYITIFTISAAKFSVLIMYYRIFSIRAGCRRAVIAAGIVSLLWLVATLQLAIWRCVPIKAAWDPLFRNAKCYNIQRAFLISEIINCVTDLVIVCIPIGMVRQLHLPLPQKLAVSMIFLLGGFVCLTSVVRIIFTYKPRNPYYIMITEILWLEIQLSSAIICACLPTYAPIMPKAASVKTHLKSRYDAIFSSSRTSSPSGSPLRSEAMAPWNNKFHHDRASDSSKSSNGGGFFLPRPSLWISSPSGNEQKYSHHQQQLLTEVKVEAEVPYPLRMEDVPINSIIVRNDVTVVREISMV